MVRLFAATLPLLFAISVSVCETRAEPIPQLIKALGDANLRQGASIALAKQGEAAVPALRESLESGNPDVASLVGLHARSNRSVCQGLSRRIVQRTLRLG